jgi:hypothetical protein
MAELGQLNHEEKVFLAGCIQAIILAEVTVRASYGLMGSANAAIPRRFIRDGEG